MIEIRDTVDPARLGEVARDQFAIFPSVRYPVEIHQIELARLPAKPLLNRPINGGDGIDSPPLPPGNLVAEVMNVAVMGPALGDCEFVADLASHGAGLSELQMVGVSGASRADQTRLRPDEFEVGLVAEPTRFADREDALVDFAGSGVGFDRLIIINDWRNRRRSRLLGGWLHLSRASPWPL